MLKNIDNLTANHYHLNCFIYTFATYGANIMAKSIGKLTYHLDVKLNILPSLQSKQTNSQNCLLKKLFVDIVFISNKQAPIDKLAALDEEAMIREIAQNVDWLKKNFKIQINIHHEFKNYTLLKRFDKILFKGNVYPQTEDNTKTPELLQTIKKFAQKNQRKHDLEEISFEDCSIAPLFITKDKEPNVDSILTKYVDEIPLYSVAKDFFGEIDSIDYLSALLNLDNPLNSLILNNDYDYFFPNNYNSIDVTGVPLRNWHLSSFFIDTFSVGEEVDVEQVQKITNKLIELSPEEVLDKFKIKDFKLIACFAFLTDDYVHSDCELQFVWQGDIPNLDNNETIDDYITGSLLEKYCEI